jgi:hypothetical protein
MAKQTVLHDGRAKALRDGAILAGWLFLAYLFLVVAPTTGTFGYDAFAYWSVDVTTAYDVPLGALGSFTYAPPIVLVADPFGVLSWPTFLFLWTMLLIGTIVWLGGGPLWIAAALAFPPVALELYHGNIHILLAAAIVLGFRHPWTWAFILLTKPTMGVGLLWFAARGEWRSLTVALATTATLCFLSWLVSPSLWDGYVGFLQQSLGADFGDAVLIPLAVWIRVLLAAAVVILGARTDRQWTVALSAWFAMPVVWVASAAVLIAIIPSLKAFARSQSFIPRATNRDMAEAGTA